MAKLSGNIARRHVTSVMVTTPVMEDLTAQVTILGIYNLNSYHGCHGYHDHNSDNNDNSDNSDNNDNSDNSDKSPPVRTAAV